MTDTDADRYYGDAAANYEAQRRRQRTWRREHSAIKAAFAELPRGQRVLDVPVGTGRFFGLYQRRELDVDGTDISADMVAAARERAEEIGLKARLTTGSILDLPYDDNTFDVAVCVRMLQWLSPVDTDTALGELARVTHGTILATAHHKLPYRLTPTAIRTRRVEKAKVRKKLRQGQQVMTIHRRDDLMRSFANHGLAVEKSVTLIHKPGWHQYDLWVLRPRSDHAS